MAETATVEVKSAWLSKINWTQAVGIVAGIVTMFGIEIDPKTQADILAAILAMQGVVTWALKTFARPSVTPTAAAKT